MLFLQNCYFPLLPLALSAADGVDDELMIFLSGSSRWFSDGVNCGVVGDNISSGLIMLLVTDDTEGCRAV